MTQRRAKPMVGRKAGLNDQTTAHIRALIKALAQQAAERDHQAQQQKISEPKKD